MWNCGSCHLMFSEYRPYQDHLELSLHWAECDGCSRTFRTWKACEQHMNATGHHANTYDCHTCDEICWDVQSAHNHMRKYNHFGLYCPDCRQFFQSEANLRAHMNSRTHRGLAISCPFCNNGFVSASGLSHHLETGSCPRAPQLNRETIIRIIRERDPNHLITTKKLTWHDTNTTYQATDRAWNGRAWECYLCHRKFNTSHALNQHANSPVHQERAYHCPKMQCRKEFVSLAALFNHLESESCGAMRFDQVQRNVHQVINSNRLIAFG